MWLRAILASVIAFSSPLLLLLARLTWKVHGVPGKLSRPSKNALPIETSMGIPLSYSFDNMIDSCWDAL